MSKMFTIVGISNALSQFVDFVCLLSERPDLDAAVGFA